MKYVLQQASEAIPSWLPKAYSLGLGQLGRLVYSTYIRLSTISPSSFYFFFDDAFLRHNIHSLVDKGPKKMSAFLMSNQLTKKI